MADGTVSVDELAHAAVEIVTDAKGKRQLKPMDVVKALMARFGDKTTKGDCKEAIRVVTDSGRLVYGYMGGASSLNLPPEEGK